MHRANTRNHTFDWMGETFAPLIDRDHFLGRSPLGTPRWNLPPANLRQTGPIFELELMVPGFDKADLTVTVEGDLLTVRGESKQEKDSGGRLLRAEFETKSFESRYRLANGLGRGQIAATCSDGLLRITFSRVLPEAEQAVRRLAISD